MSIIDDDIYDNGRESPEELLASGEYESKKENILAGFKVFQKKYIYKSVIFQLVLVVLGMASQIMNIAAAKEGEDVSFSYMLTLMCVILGIYIFMRPRSTFKKLEKSLGELNGTVYKAEIYTNKIIISILYDTYINDEEKEKAEEDKQEEKQEENENSDSDAAELPPATVIHLDNGAVEIVDCKEMFVVYIKKINVFVIPKSAFKPYENDEIRNRLSNIMGVRYKEN